MKLNLCFKTYLQTAIQAFLVKKGKARTQPSGILSYHNTANIPKMVSVIFKTGLQTRF